MSSPGPSFQWAPLFRPARGFVAVATFYSALYGNEDREEKNVRLNKRSEHKERLGRSICYTWKLRLSRGEGSRSLSFSLPSPLSLFLFLPLSLSRTHTLTHSPNLFFSNQPQYRKKGYIFFFIIFLSRKPI